MIQPTLLILAAGMGSRYGGLKQLDAMGPRGQTMLDYAVEDAILAGFGKIVFVIRKDFEDAFKAHIGSRYDRHIEVRYAFQSLDDLPAEYTPPVGRAKPWGTAQAIYAARNVIAEAFAVINADDYYGRDSYNILAKELSSVNTNKLQISMVGYALENTLSPHGTVNRGVCQTDNGRLLSVQEYSDIRKGEDASITGKDLNQNVCLLSADTMVSMNCWGFSPQIFAEIEEHLIAFLQSRGGELKSECYIPTVVDEIIHTGKAECKVLQTQSPWFGVTYPEDKAHVVECLKNILTNNA